MGRSYSKMICIVLISLSVLPLHGMKRQLKLNNAPCHAMIKKNKVELEPIFPFEFKEIFLENLTQIAPYTDIKKMGTYIHNLSLLNHHWNDYINDRSIMRTIIGIIYDLSPPRLYNNHHAITKFIATAGSKNYMAQNALLYNKLVSSPNICVPYSIKELVEKGADFNGYNTSSFLYLASINNYTYTQQLLDLGANPNTTEYGETPLEAAIGRNQSSMVALLLKYKPENKGLLLALEKGNSEITAILLEKAHFTKEELETAYFHIVKVGLDNAAVKAFMVYYANHQ